MLLVVYESLSICISHVCHANDQIDFNTYSKGDLAKKGDVILEKGRCTFVKHSTNTMGISNLSGQISALAFLCGILVHRTFLIRGEWNLYWPRLLFIHFVTPELLWARLIFVAHLQPSISARLIATVYADYTAGLLSSMAVYRVFLHPLRRFPGPFWAKLTTLWPATTAAKREELQFEMQQSHTRYGDFVRYG